MLLAQSKLLLSEEWSEVNARHPALCPNGWNIPTATPGTPGDSRSFHSELTA